jgi:tyrosine-protein kinase Etk/Wzc
MHSGLASSGSFAEDVSRIQSRLVIAADRLDTRVVSIFGMTPGAGTSTISLSIASGLASQSLSVALVDASVESSSVHEAFRLDPAPGVAEVLASPAPLPKALRSTDVENLHVMPAGNWPRPREAQLPERWKKLFAPLRDTHRMVIVDAGSTDSAHVDGILHGSDGVVLVVERGRSRWEQIAAFAERTDELKIPFLGVILNTRRLLS